MLPKYDFEELKKDFLAKTKPLIEVEFAETMAFYEEAAKLGVGYHEVLEFMIEYHDKEVVDRNVELLEKIDELFYEDEDLL